MKQLVLILLLGPLLMPLAANAQAKKAGIAKDSVATTKARVHVVYIVNTDSTISSLKAKIVECEGCNGSKDKAYLKGVALDMVRKAPRPPSIQNGKPQRTQYTQPFVIELADTTKAGH